MTDQHETKAPTPSPAGEPPGIDLAAWETRGILAGQITMLLRPVTPAPELWLADGRPAWAGRMPDGSPHDVEGDALGRFLATCPFGARGAELVGREVWGMHSSGVWYQAPDALRRWHEFLPSAFPTNITIDVGKEEPGPRRASTMPVWAARLRLRLTHVLVLNVMDIDAAVLTACGRMPALTTGVWYWRLKIELADAWRPTLRSDFTPAEPPRAPTPEAKTCAGCGAIAVCRGTYAGGVEEYACDGCCRHVQSEGNCVPLAAPPPPGSVMSDAVAREIEEQIIGGRPAPELVS